MRMRILQLVFMTLISVGLHAQVTTSSMTGKITDNGGEELIGATVIATHIPTGTNYSTVTNVNGIFNIGNMRPGGPYRISVSYLGYTTENYENINLLLGQPFILDAKLKSETVTIDDLLVIASRSNILNSNRTGAATNISTNQINSLPTISRSINDFTRLTPQAQGNNFAGRDGRYNNIQIDGANFNNNFGLSDNPLPGGSAQPISLDAISEIQVNIAPYDVRQSNFTGAGINAITRSGSNTFEGSVYGFYRDNTFNGRKVGDIELPEGDKTTSNTIGARLGGAIVKDKLFFFVNAEIEDNTSPGLNFRPTGDPQATSENTSRTTVEDMNRVSNFLQERYGYNTGRAFGYADNFKVKNHKALARIDWNISNDHRLTFRYNEVVNTSDQVVNGTSAPNPRAASNRVSQNSFAFENAHYGFENSVRSVTAELNSNFSSNLTNQLLVTYTNIQDKRTSKSDPFPFVDIWKDGDSYMSFGYELFSWKNEVINKVTTVTNNLTYFSGKHTVTAGLSFDYLSFQNSFQRYGTSYYRFNSVDDFINGATPSAFGLTYSLLPGGTEPVAALDFGLLGAYLQDEFRATDKLKLTIGLRADVPFYLNDLVSNPAVNALTFVNQFGTGTEKLDVGNWPTSKILWSPRVGFNYDITEDRTIQLRGGTGIFSGRVPFVWFTNMPTNSGMIQNTVELAGNQVTNAGITFNPDPRAHVDLFPQNAGQSAPGSIAAIDENFKLPQVLRSNLAIDAQLPGNLVLTLEGLYTKDLVAIYQYNANQKAPVGEMNVANGADRRPFFGANNAERRVNPTMSEAMVLTNTDQGHSYSLTAGLSKEFSKGLFASLAYTYTDARDLSGNPGSQAASAWSGNPAVRGHNDLDFSFAQFAVPHRVVGSFSYRFEYLKSLATTISLFYDGANTGRYSYRYTADFNRDGINADLIYIPRDPSEITFTDVVSGGNVQFTAQQQSDAFFAYIDQDPYLSKNKGKYADRNGALFPWRHRFDLRLLQDIFTNIKGRRNTLQLSIDILNVGNLVNSDWGIIQTTNYNNGAILVPNVAANGTATFQMARVNNQLPTTTFRNITNTSTTWGMQVGLRYIF